VTGGRGKFPYKTPKGGGKIVQPGNMRIKRLAKRMGGQGTKDKEKKEVD